MGLRKRVTAGLAAASCLLLAACGTPGGEGGESKVDLSKIGNEVVKVNFSDNNEVLQNPLMGWQVTMSMQEVIDYGVPEGYGSVLLRQAWDELEPEEGQFQWELLDRSLEICKEAGVSIQMGMYLQASDVWGFKGIPDWVWEKYDIPYQIVDSSSFESVDRENYPTKHPLYYNKVYQEKVRNFLTAVAQRYPDGTADILDVRFYGLYGEWDAGWNPFDWGGDRDLKRETLSDMLHMYMDVFKDYKKTKLCIDVAHIAGDEYKWQDYRTEACHDIALENGFAIRSCGVGVDNYYGMTKFVMDEAYSRFNPTNAETWYGWNPGQFDLQKTLDTFYSAHVNTMTFGMATLSADYIREQNREMFDSAAKTMGYRLIPREISYPRSVKAGDSFEFVSTWANTGVGLCWRPYPLKLTVLDVQGNEVWSQVDQEFNQTQWIKGKKYTVTSSLTIPAELAEKKGDYELYISMVDDQGKNAIALPVGDTGNKARLYKVGSFAIKD